MNVFVAVLLPNSRKVWHPQGLIEGNMGRQSAFILQVG